LFVANAGDSRCVLGRGGLAVALSFDHKPENDEERRRIEHAGSTITEGRVDGNLNLSRSLGDLKYK
jgi:protein phosphatase 1G